MDKAATAVEGAAANALPGAVPEEVKEERLERFMAVQAEISAAKLAAKVGRPLLADCTDLLLRADADTGYGNALNVQRTVRAYEKAGAFLEEPEGEEMERAEGRGQRSESGGQKSEVRSQRSEVRSQKKKK